MNDRDSENHPSDRAGDKSRWSFVWQHKLYRDFWLLCVTALVVIALTVNANQTDAIQASRIEATKYSCAKYNDLVASNNESISYIESLILSGAVLPGDQPEPAGVKPSDWETLTAGPLSNQLAKQFPAFPSAQERLSNAQEQATGLSDTKVPPRDCKSEVEFVRSATEDG